MSQAVKRNGSALTEPAFVRYTLIGFVFLMFVLLLFTPLVFIFATAFRDGWDVYVRSVTEPNALAAVKLTLVAAVSAVVFNLIFGIAAAWAVTKFRFKGKNFLTALIDLPFSVSPVIAGLVFILLLGNHGPLGRWLIANDFKVIFAVPGIILATVFVTFPFIARELISLMQEQGTEEEEAAILLGASGWKTFLRITLPNIKIGLFYGIVLCSARAIGEFGAVSVVSGHIRGMTNTVPLHIEILYNEYQFTAAFAVSTILASTAVITLTAKRVLENISERKRAVKHENNH
ncbi:sulfate ABC transporter permease subunit CysW [Geovibrio thiophilus]|uniref:Sulfate ABC transporter permease subunit CysW n=1 Tax=Geovibrio thiophilus TaxID=139438 RepID=A0A3R5UUG2_9BACT|nr:sulfate ABC transporter permease subunit CysW [Geovibrio thiophilus]QAR32819.1 sulfate ABC transporter permease subunit CysW [Geovibrio thiophilus]